MYTQYTNVCFRLCVCVCVCLSEFYKCCACVDCTTHGMDHFVCLYARAIVYAARVHVHGENATCECIE